MRPKFTLTDLLIGGANNWGGVSGQPEKNIRGVLIVAPLPPKSEFFGPNSRGDSKITRTKRNNGDTHSL